MLRRVLVWNGTRFFLQPDPKHFQNLAGLLEVSGVKPAPTPISKRDGAHVERCAGTTRQSGSYLYRRCVGICMYPGPDRYDVKFTVKGLASDMQAPPLLSMARLRRLVRDLCGTLHIGMSHMNQDKVAELTIWTDGDRSGDVQTCNSTSSGAIQIGAHTVETWSVSQKVVSLSSAEREFAAIGGGTSRGLTVKHVLQEVLGNIRLGAKIPMVVRTDSNAARSMLHRVRCGRARHLAPRYLWHQDALKDGLFEGKRCASKDNPADFGTKALDSETRERLLGVLCIVSRQALRRTKGRECWQCFCSGQVWCPERESTLRDSVDVTR